MNDVDTVEPQRVEGHRHRAGQPRRIGALELETQTAAAARDEEIELGAGVRGPVVRFPGPEREPANHLFEGEAFEACAHLRMGREIGRLLDSEQRVQQPAVGDVDLG